MENNLTSIFTVMPGEEGVRLDVFCSSKVPGLSRNKIQNLNKAGLITVNSQIKAHHYNIKAGDRIEVRIPPEKDQAESLVPEKIPLKIVYEDEDIVMVNKTAGMVVHPAHGNWEGTLVNALLGLGLALAPKGGKLRPGIVHRLDKDTSGLMVVAKSDTAYDKLSLQIKERKFAKIYHAIIWGNLGVPNLTVDHPVGRHPLHRKKMAAVKSGGREAVTKMFIMDSFGHFEYIRLVLNTGRTHQIRVHLSNISHPILGDAVYGGRRKRGHVENARVKRTLDKLLKIMSRQALHASGLSFTHPVSGKWITFKTSLPADMRAALETLFLEDQGG